MVSKKRLSTLAQDGRLLLMAALLAAVIQLAGAPSTTYAATLTVNSTADAVVAGDGECTLREAIRNANANSDTTGGDCPHTGGPYGNDLITFDPTTNGTPIILTGPAGENGNAGGDLDIVGWAGNLTIQGNGPENTIIDGNNIDRVVQVCFNFPCRSVEVIFSGLTIQNGRLSNYGAGIFNWAQLTLRNTVVRNNEVDYFGGGIYNDAGLVVEAGSLITGNQAEMGGGVYVGSGMRMTLSQSAIEANTASINGGGIYSLGSLLMENEAVIGGAGTGNQARRGGGIFGCGSSTTTVDNSLISGNVATNDGGGIYSGGNLTVRNRSTIGGEGAGNQAEQGGGIFNYSGSTTITDSRLLNNLADITGGGIYSTVDVAGGTAVTGSCITGNSNVAFINDEAAQQVATGNWWGTPTGPNTFGADTTGGSIDTAGYLTAPILGCPVNWPDLQVTKTNDTGGGGTVDLTFNWTLTVTNTGPANAIFSAGQRILVDELPPGPVYTPPVLRNLHNVTGGEAISCSLADDLLGCETTADVVIGARTGSFEVLFSVTPNAAGTLKNPPDESICRVDPDGVVTESDKVNNSCPPNQVTITAPTAGPPARPAPVDTDDDDDDDEEDAPAVPAPPPVVPDQAFDCWPWLAIVPRLVVPGAEAICQPSLGAPLPAPSDRPYLGHSTELVIQDAAGTPRSGPFTPPLKICFRYTPAELAVVDQNPDRFLIQTLRGGVWESLPTRVESDPSPIVQGRVCSPVEELALFALFRDKSVPVSHPVETAPMGPLAGVRFLPETGVGPVYPRVGKAAHPTVHATIPYHTLLVPVDQRSGP